MNQIYKSLGIVLGVYDSMYYEGVYKILSKDYGVIFLNARGVKNIKSKNIYALELGSLSQIYFTPRKIAKSYMLTGAVLEWKPNFKINSFTKNKLLLKGMYVINRLLNNDFSFDDFSREYYYLLKYLTKIDQMKSYKEALLVYISYVLFLLDRFGFRPNLKNCLNCNKKTLTKDIYYS